MVVEAVVVVVVVAGALVVVVVVVVVDVDVVEVETIVVDIDADKLASEEPCWTFSRVNCSPDFTEGSSCPGTRSPEPDSSSLCSLSPNLREMSGPGEISSA